MSVSVDPNKRYSVILGIESSCDETAASVVVDGRKVLSNVISSQVPVHTIYGGVVPEIASRKHIENIDVVIEKALTDASMTFEDIDAIAVTYGPGLVGALLVGVSEAKALAYALNKPLLGVHHLKGHIAANYITRKDWEPPFLCLVVSGGHTDVILVEDYVNYRILGRTRDDAAGEAFDKVARSIGLGYPGGPKIQKAAMGEEIPGVLEMMKEGSAGLGQEKKEGALTNAFGERVVDGILYTPGKAGDPYAIDFPRPCLEEEGYNFSFSGLKSAVLNYLNTEKMMGHTVSQADVAASFQQAVVDVLVNKTMKAAKEMGVKRVAAAGGVSANLLLRTTLEESCRKEGLDFCRPEMILCTDNAAMIASAAYYAYEKGQESPLDLNAYPNLTL